MGIYDRVSPWKLQEYAKQKDVPMLEKSTRNKTIKSIVDRCVQAVTDDATVNLLAQDGAKEWLSGKPGKAISVNSVDGKVHVTFIDLYQEPKAVVT